MKAALNGVLNLSILDGWWDECYGSAFGWAIPSADEDGIDPGERDAREAASILDLIEHELAPRFYERARRPPPRLARHDPEHGQHARTATPRDAHGARLRRADLPPDGGRRGRTGRKLTELAAAAARVGDRRRWIALCVVCLAMFMNTIDGSVVNVALPAIQTDLGIAQSDLTWVINAYLISFGSFLLLAGRLGDLVGRKRVFLSGVTLFTLASVLCGLAQDEKLLIAARFVQGLGGAVSSSVIIAMIVSEFPEPRERAKAMSAYIFVAVGGGSVGLLVGGLVTQAIDWHWIFFINIPIGAVDAAARPRAAGGERAARARQGRRLARVDRRHRGADARHLRHRDDPRPRLGVGAHARLRRRRGAPADLLLLAPGAHRESDHAAADPARARPRRHEPRARPARQRAVLDVLPRRALPRAGARLQRAAHGRRVPPALARGRRALGRHHRAPDGPLRRHAA